jgi:hypothetical protein
MESTSATAEEPCVEVAGFTNSSADREGIRSDPPSNRRQKAKPTGATMVPLNRSDAEEVQNQSAVDVAEVSIHI